MKANADDVDLFAWRLPGEYEPVGTLFVTWSGGVSDDWKTFAADVARAASKQTHVVVIVSSTDGDNTSLIASARDAMKSAGANMDQVSFQAESLDSNWIRDYGPEVVRGRLGLRIAMHADCCSESGRPSDGQAGPHIAWDVLHVATTNVQLGLQGGNILSDGQGRCITTDAMVADNGGDAAAVEQQLTWSFGCKTLSVVPALDGEPNGHVDMVVTITGPAQAMVGRASSDDPTNADRLDRAARTLAADGFAVRRVPMPLRNVPADPSLGGMVFPSYTNAIAVNGAVLVPVFWQDRSYEAEALEVFREAYPGRTIVPIEAGALIAFGGAVHCATMTVAR